MTEKSERTIPLEPHIAIVRTGHGANCSSIGSVIDTLFVTALASGAIFAAVAAALESEEVRVASPPTKDGAPNTTPSEGES